MIYISSKFHIDQTITFRDVRIVVLTLSIDFYSIFPRKRIQLSFAHNICLFGISIQVMFIAFQPLVCHLSCFISWNYLFVIVDNAFLVVNGRESVWVSFLCFAPSFSLKTNLKSFFFFHQKYGRSRKGTEIRYTHTKYSWAKSPNEWTNECEQMEKKQKRKSTENESERSQQVTQNGIERKMFFETKMYASVAQIFFDRMKINVYVVHLEEILNYSIRNYFTWCLY